MDTPSTQGSAFKYVTAASEKFRLDIKSKECHNQEFKQNLLLDVKDISLNHGSDAIQ